MATATVAKVKVKAGKKAAAKVREAAAPEKAVPRATANPAEPTAVVGKASNGGSGYTSGNVTVATAPVAVLTPVAPVRRTKSDAKKVDERLAMAFKQLGDPTRLRVIRHLADAGAENVTGLCETMGMSQPAVSHHLSLMRYAGVVEATRRGKSSIYTLTPRGEILARLASELESAG